MDGDRHADEGEYTGLDKNTYAGISQPGYAYG